MRAERAHPVLPSRMPDAPTRRPSLSLRGQLIALVFGLVIPLLVLQSWWIGPRAAAHTLWLLLVGVAYLLSLFSDWSAYSHRVLRLFPISEGPLATLILLRGLSTPIMWLVLCGLCWPARSRFTGERRFQEARPAAASSSR